MRASKRWKSLARCARKPREATDHYNTGAEETVSFCGDVLSEGAVANSLEWQHLRGVAAEVLNALAQPLESLR
jgi:hypothetical protein